MSPITSGLAMRFGVSEGQPAVLGRAAALCADREQIERACPTHRRPRRAHGERGTACPTGNGAGIAPVSGSSAGGVATRVAVAVVAGRAVGKPAGRDGAAVRWSRRWPVVLGTPGVGWTGQAVADAWASARW